MKQRPIQLVLIFVTGILSQDCALAQMPTTKVVVVEAKMVDARSTITLVGTVEPVRRSRVSTEIAGLVKEMPARQGDRIIAGGVICRLNDDILQLLHAAEAAKLESLRARHEELLAGTRKEELRRLKAFFDEAVTEDERWKFEMARIEKLYANRDSNEKEYNDTRAEFLAAERRKIAAEAVYKLAVEGPRKETIAQAAHDAAEQQAVVDRIAADLAKAVIRAPFTGYVVERLVEIGEWIPEGGPVVEMIDLSSVLVRVDVPESALPYLVIGHSARVKVDALKRSFEGRIKHIMRQADRSARTFPVEIEVDNPDQPQMWQRQLPHLRLPLLAGGMFARATVSAGPTNRITAVPKDAIVERDGITYVARITPGPQGDTAGVLSPVTVGIDVDDWVTITSGNVRPGTSVITRGNERILPFPMPVEIVNEKGTPVAMPTPGAPAPSRPPEADKGADRLTVDKPRELEGT